MGREVEEVTGVDDDRSDTGAFALAPERLNIGWIPGLRLPLSGASGEYLDRVTAPDIGTIDGVG